MKRLDGNNILIVDREWHYAVTLGETLSDVGAICTSTSSIQQARTTLINYDFDLIICSQYLDDGTITDLYNWAKSHLPMMPVFAALNENKIRNEELLKDCELAGFLDKEQPGELLQEVSKFLFNFEDFVDCIVNMTDTSTIHYELHLGEDEYLFRPLEATDEGIFFNMDETYKSHHMGFLRIYFFDGSVAKAFTLAGRPEHRIKGGHFFNVHPHYRPTWKRVMKKLEAKQVHISSFLKKAAGF